MVAVFRLVRRRLLQRRRRLIVDRVERDESPRPYSDVDVAAKFNATVAFWRGWLRHVRYSGRLRARWCIAQRSHSSCSVGTPPYERPARAARTLAFEGSPPNSNERPVTPPDGRACVGYLAVVCHSDRPASIRSRMDGTRPKMTTPLIDNTVPITAGTTHAPSSSPTATTSWPHPAATKPAYDHDMQYP
jgi:hypothetical protein